jgi:RNA polymerase sigma-70 factor (ECF subfamily)
VGRVEDMVATGQGEFESLRQHLLAVAYRLTGSVADAEDMVQDAWLRWASADRGAVEDPRAWLTTVVSRLSLDWLRSATHRRETYVGSWLPEPVVVEFGADDPLAAVVAAEDARFAAMVVLERLSPDQRVAFVLHDGFGVEFATVAEVLGTTPTAARQLASRARRIVSDGQAPPRDPAHDEVVGRLMAAFAAGDIAEVVELLHPDVTFTGDANRRAPTAPRPVVGAEKVARFLFGLARRYGPAFFTASRLALVNGELGAYSPGVTGDPGHPDMMPRVLAMTVRDGRVWAVWDVANPDKFSGTPLAARSPRAPGTRPRS